MRKTLSWFLIFAVGLAIVGCRRAEDPATTTTGTIEGAPLKGGNVPDQSGGPRPSTAPPMDDLRG